MIQSTELNRLSSLSISNMTLDDAWEIVKQPEFFHIDQRKIALSIIQNETND